MHKPVLLKETVSALQIGKASVTIVDATVNRGGHSKEVLSQMAPKSTLICIDLDKGALLDAKNDLESYAKERGVSTFYVQDNFRNLEKILNNLSIEKIDGLIADLGISSQELDSSERGFSFRFDEPLQMTFKDTLSEDDLTAKDVVNNWSLETLTLVITSFSDERYAYRIAKGILTEREVKPITTTFELIECIRRSTPIAYHYGKTHFATKTFQAIRMAVNDELGSLVDLIDSLPRVLEKNARASVITFHSTEDRMLKHEVRKRENELAFVSKKAIMPEYAEIINNPRARSAQLRIIKRL
jgi:16S rRNA (cytosine1402-N4)-methyltransferase